MIHVEYSCTKCGETYLPGEPGEDHGVEETGQECGGVGVFTAISWAPGTPPGEVEDTIKEHLPYETGEMM